METLQAAGRSGSGDDELLSRYAGGGDEAAFRQLVERLGPMTHAAAMRRTGNPEIAREVTQITFSRLAVEAPSLPRAVLVSGWLHAMTRRVASDLMRSEKARKAREARYAIHRANQQEIPSDSRALAAVLDPALDSLPRADKEAVFMRFIEERSLSEVARAHGVSEEAARKRIERALGKLRAALLRRGITTSSSALALALPVHASVRGAQALSASELHRIADKAVRHASAGASGWLSFFQKVFPGVLALALLVLVVWQRQAIGSLREEAMVSASLEAAGDFRAMRRESHPAGVSAAQVGLNLARIADPVEREAELARWADQFSSAREIHETVANLGAGTSTLRGIIAPHLTRRWAEVDADDCIRSFLAMAAQRKGTPFAEFPNREDVPPVVANRELLFSLIAIHNPDGFSKWAATRPVSELSALVAQDGLLRGEIHDVFLSLARFAPGLVLGVAENLPSGEQSTLLRMSGLAYGLASEPGAWERCSSLPPSEARDELLEWIAEIRLAADAASPGEVIRNTVDPETPSGYARISAAAAMLEKAFPGDADPVLRERWLGDVEALASIVNRARNEGKSPDSLYYRLARLSARNSPEDLEPAAGWLEAIPDRGRRLEAAARLAFAVQTGFDPAARLYDFSIDPENPSRAAVTTNVMGHVSIDLPPPDREESLAPMLRGAYRGLQPAKPAVKTGAHEDGSE